MVQHINANDVVKTLVGKRKLLRIYCGIQPRRRQEIGRYRLRNELLEIARPTADFQGAAISRKPEKPDIEIAIDVPQHWLPPPDFPLIGQDQMRHGVRSKESNS